MKRPSLARVSPPSLLSAAPLRRAALVVDQPRTVNSNAWQPAGKPALHLGPQVIQEARPLGGLGRGGGQGQQYGEEQGADGQTVVRTVDRTVDGMVRKT